ncbi:hypothetical protein KY308_02120 [Candidatus Woesearchaeota archaeon]|nr:hypothetical protein [Candidatus Woesearchaeota archaeon]
MKRRGRPVKSQIRQNIVEILHFLGEGYGYDIYKVYMEVFPKCTQKSIYYHLKKGLVTGEFIIKRVEKEKGDFSWGGEVEKTYYALGPKASPQADSKVKEAVEEYVKKRKQSRQGD